MQEADKATDAEKQSASTVANDSEIVIDAPRFTISAPPQIPSTNGSISTSSVGMPADPKLIRQIAKMLRDSEPKHENYKWCRKRCPNFKSNRCYILDHKVQMECWKSWHDENNKATKEAPLTNLKPTHD